MKKVMCLLLTIMFTLIFTCVGFAAVEDIVDDPTAPGSGQTVTEDMYDEEPPYTPPEVSEAPKEITIEDADTPASGELVQTGGVPAWIFYIAGGVCILAALVLATRKSKESNAG